METLSLTDPQVYLTLGGIGLAVLGSYLLYRVAKFALGLDAKKEANDESLDCPGCDHCAEDYPQKTPSQEDIVKALEKENEEIKKQVEEATKDYKYAVIWQPIPVPAKAKKKKTKKKQPVKKKQTKKPVKKPVKKKTKTKSRKTK